MSRPQYRFCLYVADDSPNSTIAVANLTSICSEYVDGRYEIEVVDVFKQPERALAEGILMTPTLVRLHPSPVRRIVGTLTQTETVVQTMGLGRTAA